MTKSKFIISTFLMSSFVVITLNIGTFMILEDRIEKAERDLIKAISAVNDKVDDVNDKYEMIMPDSYTAE